jgi:hypothetical protein
LTPQVPRLPVWKTAACPPHASWKERAMPKIAVPAATAAVLICLTTVTYAERPRSSQYQPDFSTCSSSRDACVIGTTRRGDDRAKCDKAFAACMRTGTWDTYGLYGRRVEGIARR